jgi:glycerophosphoryl diester phosphodiesterase
VSQLAERSEGAGGPAIYAHRLGGAYGPESSRAALERSLEEGVDGVEIDVVLSRDGEVLCIHDPFLGIATDAEGWAHEKPARELLRTRLLDDEGDPSDEHPIALAELLDRLPRDIAVQLDIKAYADSALARATAERCCELATEMVARDRVEVISFFAEACAAAVERDVSARIVTWSDHDPEGLAALASERGMGVAAEGFILSPRLWNPLAAAGVTISVGAINDQDQLEHLPGTPQIVVSDCPHMLLPT